MSRSSARSAAVLVVAAMAVAVFTASCGGGDEASHRGQQARQGTQLQKGAVSVGVVSADEGEDAGLQLYADGQEKTVVLKPGDRAEIAGHVVELVAIEGKGSKGRVWVEIDPAR